jgi:hypothetical protein
MACPIAWCAFSWEAFATLVTGVSAVAGAVWVANGQMKIQKKQTNIQAQALRSDLFERRYRVFDETEKLLREVINTGSPNHDASQPFRAAKGEAHFLFDESVVSGLDEIWRKICEYQVLITNMNSNYQSAGNYGDGNPDKKENALLWFSDRLNTLPKLFHVMKLHEQFDKN